MPAPTSLRIKRKREDAPVDALLVQKRHKPADSEPDTQPLRPKFFFRRLTRPNDAPNAPVLPPPASQRRFHLQGHRDQHVFVEARPAAPNPPAATVHDRLQVPAPDSTSQETPRPRKRPGVKAPTIHQKPSIASLSAQDVRELEDLSHQVAQETSPSKKVASPSKYKPRAPARRFADRHPDKAASLAAQDEDAMDLDGDYVYDTYIREPIMPDAPTPAGVVGFLVIADEDEEWWNADDESDREFATDDEDENAEDYYANDYPEDELSEDDEFGRDLYQPKYRVGSDDEDGVGEEDDGDEGIKSGEDEDDVHFRMTVPKVVREGYWGGYAQQKGGKV